MKKTATHGIPEARFIELYSEFRRALPDAIQLELAPRPKPFAGKHFHLLAMMFHEAAEDALRELANGINEFRNYIRRLDAWRPIFTSLPEIEQHEVMIEHIRPLSVLCLSTPYALRGRILYATCSVSFHASHFLEGRTKDPQWRGKHVDWKIAKQLAGDLTAWPALSAALSEMNGPSFSEKTSDFRNNHQHGQPRAVALGHVAAIHQVPGSPNTWSFGVHEPLAIGDMIEPLAREHALALAAFRAFIALVDELHAAEPSV